MTVYEDADASHVEYIPTNSLTHYAGAAASLALVMGVSVWGYQLIMRDVSGIPVVQAAEGAMRVAPQDAGGEIADHAGLAVNEVAGQGEAAGPVDQLMLAPERAGLAQEDLEVAPLAEAEEVVVAAPETVILPATVEAELTETAPAPLTPETALALAESLAATATPLTDLAEGEAVAPVVALDGVPVAAAPAVEVIDASVPGVVTSMRPVVRPASLVIQASAPAAPEADIAALVAQQVAASTDAVAAAVAEAALVNVAAVPAGSYLVQLGLYASPEDAAVAWTGMKAQFGSMMDAKDRVIQEAASNGETFYRLRASGFVDEAASRQFCEALRAGNAECVPVVVR